MEQSRQFKGKPISQKVDEANKRFLAALDKWPGSSRRGEATDNDIVAEGNKMREEQGKKDQ